MTEKGRERNVRQLSHCTGSLVVRETTRHSNQSPSQESKKKKKKKKKKKHKYITAVQDTAAAAAILYRQRELVAR